MTDHLATLAAALLTASCAALLVPARLPTIRPVSRRPGGRVSSPAAALVLVLALVMAVGVVLGLLPSFELVSVLVVCVVGAAMAGVALLTARARRRARADRRRGRVVAVCEALLGELRAGQPPAVALGRAARVWPELAPAVAAAELGSSVPEALRQIARSPGAGALGRIAAAWEICASTGSGLGLAVERVLDTVRQEQATARMVASELASARATARLVAALPVVVLLAADGVGAQPWAFLFGTLPGVVCLGAGLGCGWLGLWWIDRIAAEAVGGG